jgi:hypothetical protein
MFWQHNSDRFEEPFEQKTDCLCERPFLFQSQEVKESEAQAKGGSRDLRS